MLTKRTIYGIVSLAGLMVFGLDGAQAQRHRSHKSSPQRQRQERKTAGPCFIKPKDAASPKRDRTPRFVPIKDEVVLVSVDPDWDCDGIADPQDNCIGIPNRDQIDNDRSGIGDACEAAANVRAGIAVKRDARAVEARLEDRRKPSDRKTKKDLDERKEQRSRNADRKKTTVATRRRAHR